MGSHPFRIAMEKQDPARIGQTLAPDVVLHSPVLFRPFEGREIVGWLLPILRDTFEEAYYTDEFTEEGKTALIFRGRIGDRQAEGLQLVRFNSAGLVDDITVMLRPLSALQALSEAIGPRLRELPRTGRGEAG